MEEQLNLIALGRADFHAVLQHTVEIFKQKFHYFVQSIEAMDQLFEVSFSPLSASGKAHSRYTNSHTGSFGLIFRQLFIFYYTYVYNFYILNALHIYSLFFDFSSCICICICVTDVANVVDI